MPQKSLCETDNPPKADCCRGIETASIILALSATKPTGHEWGKGESTAGKRKYGSQKELLSKIALTGLGVLCRAVHV